MFEHIIVIVLIASVITAVKFHMQKRGSNILPVKSCHGEGIAHHDNSQTENCTQSFKTRDLVLKTIKNIGCSYELDEKDERIIFKYQGATFAVDAEDGCPFINIWYLWWGEYELYDIDNLSRLRRTINDANIKFATSAFYSINETGGTLDIHSKRNALFIEQIHDIAGYFKALLDEFFRNRIFILTEVEKIKKEEESMKSI